MDMTSTAIAGVLLGHTPFVVVAAVGLWLAWVRRTGHPRVSAWAAVGFGSFIAHSVCRAGTQIVVQLSFRQPSASVTALAGRLVVLNAVIYALLLLSLVCLIRAVFIDREAPAD